MKKDVKNFKTDPYVSGLTVPAPLMELNFATNLSRHVRQRFATELEIANVKLFRGRVPFSLDGTSMAIRAVGAYPRMNISVPRGLFKPLRL